jgi:hypothetical protein
MISALDPQARSTLESLELDFVLQLEAGPVPELALGVSRQGLWRFDLLNRPRPPAYQEILDGKSVVTVRLETVTDDAGACRTSPAQAAVRVRPHSYVQTLDQVLGVAAELPALACRRMLAGAPLTMRKDAADVVGVHPRDEKRDVARFFTRLAKNFVVGQLRSVLVHPQWNVGVVDTPISCFLNPAFVPQVQWLADLPHSHFLADPFGAQAFPDGPWLAESFDFAAHRGSITATGPGRSATDPPVIELDAHASYPYLVEHDGEIFCIPQIDGAEGIRWFRALEYPTRWEAGDVIVPDALARDATVFCHGGRWWVAFTDARAGADSHLHLWFSDDFRGPWAAHAGNPVKIDVRSARPAGTPFTEAGVLYRPAQDCSTTYGGAVAICRVDALSPTTFSEEVVRTVTTLPGRFDRGTHTLASVGEVTLVDGKRFIFSVPGTARAVRNRLARRRPSPSHGGGSEAPRGSSQSEPEEPATH